MRQEANGISNSSEQRMNLVITENCFSDICMWQTSLVPVFCLPDTSFLKLPRSWTVGIWVKWTSREVGYGHSRKALPFLRKECLVSLTRLCWSRLVTWGEHHPAALQSGAEKNDQGPESRMFPRSWIRPGSSLALPFGYGKEHFPKNFRLVVSRSVTGRQNYATYTQSNLLLHFLYGTIGVIMG